MTFDRSDSRFRLLAVATLLALVCAAPALADRPSLLDMDAELAQVVAGLCGGDASLCGQGVPPGNAGRVSFGGAIGTLTFHTLSFSYGRPFSGGGGAALLSFDPLLLTVEEGLVGVDLLSAVANATPLPSVVIDRWDEAGQSYSEVFRLTNVVLGAATQSGITQLELGFETVQMTHAGQSSSWDLVANVGSGCTVAGSVQHVDPQALSVSLLAPGQVPTPWSMGARRPAGGGGPATPSFTFERDVTSDSACYLRSGGAASNLTAEFHRLDAQSEPLATQLRDETLKINDSVVGRVEVEISAGQLREHISLHLEEALYTTREFDAQGSETNTRSILLSF